jgi:hypothetical protein
VSKQTVIGAVALFLSSAPAFAEFPVVGTRYQLDRAQFPGQLAICATESAMVRYFTLKVGIKDHPAAEKMLVSVDTMKDFDRLKASGGCTLISSFSQAKVIERGKGAHRAEFMAFPFGPMWGVAAYFGRPVN